MPKIIQKSFKNGQKIDKNPSKIDQKSIKNRSKIDKIGSWAPRGSKRAPRALQDPKGTPRGHRLGEGFWEGFGAMLAPRATKKPFKMHSKFSSFLMSIFHRFFIDFSSILDGFWEGFGRHVGLQEALKIKLQY